MVARSDHRGGGDDRSVQQRALDSDCMVGIPFRSDGNSHFGHPIQLRLSLYSGDNIRLFFYDMGALRLHHSNVLAYVSARMDCNGG